MGCDLFSNVNIRKVVELVAEYFLTATTAKFWSNTGYATERATYL